MQIIHKRPLLLKIIAIVTMVIDHVGAIFFPHILWLRLIGRLCFPIIGYSLATGFNRTSNKFNYALRLGVFAILSQYIYLLAFRELPFSYNIFVTLLISFFVIWITQSEKLSIWLKSILILCLGLFSFILPIEYGVLGIISIVLMYFLQNRKYLLIISQIVIWALYCLIHIFVPKSMGMAVSLPTELLQAFAPVGVVIIYVINSINITAESFSVSKFTKKLIQYGFYIFYPLHLLILYLISLVK
jgi:hypothetical protein